MQASPSDPKNFPFILLGNKIDIDGGNSRSVRLPMNCFFSQTDSLKGRIPSNHPVLLYVMASALVLGIFDGAVVLKWKTSLCLIYYFDYNSETFFLLVLFLFSG